MNRKQRREVMRKIQAQDLNLEAVHADAAGIDIGNGRPGTRELFSFCESQNFSRIGRSFFPPF
jgi:hypothetical protein